MSELKQHLCPVCQKEDWYALDTIVITCPKCAGQKMIKVNPEESKTCDLCQGQGRVNYQLRDKKYWFDKNFLYNEEVGMKVCKACGFITYSPRWTEEELKTRYTQNRMVVNPPLIVQANIKNEFHKYFLESESREFKSILDIGCSFGNIRKIFLGSKIYGIEYSSRFAKYAKNENKIDIIEKTQDLPDKCIDLVMIYHTLEHVSNPRETLLEVKRVLKDDGLFYVAVPDYLRILHEVSSSVCLDFEQLYHLNHNNVFTHNSLHNLLKQCGFETIKTNNQYYGEAVLCKINDAVDKTMVQDNWPVIENKLYHQRMAIEILSHAHKNQNADHALMGIEAALAQDSTYVDAYECLMVQKVKFQDVRALCDLWDRIVAAGCETMRLRDRFAIMLLNWCDAGQVNNYIRKSEELFLKSLSIFPGDSEALLSLLKIYAYNYKDVLKAEEYADKLLKLNPMAWAEIQNILSQVKCLD